MGGFGRRSASVAVLVWRSAPMRTILTRHIEGEGVSDSGIVGSGSGKWLAVTIVLGIAAFIMSPNAPLGGFWGTPPSLAPTGAQMALLMLLTAIQSLAVGLGAAFLIFGWSLIKSQLPTKRDLGLATYLSVAWSLISWWPHSNFHQTLSMGNVSGLIAIEYAFHVTLILGGLIVACFFITKARQA